MPAGFMVQFRNSSPVFRGTGDLKGRHYSITGIFRRREHRAAFFDQRECGMNMLEVQCNAKQ
jgi:hypothetical protein